MKDLKSFKQKYVPESEIYYSRQLNELKKDNANNINKSYIDLVKRAKVDSIFNDNI